MSRFVTDYHVYRLLTKEDLFSNFVNHIDLNTVHAFHSLIADKLIIEIKKNGTSFYCLNIFEKAEQIRAEINGKKQKIIIDVDQPLDKEFDELDFVFPTEANRAVPNRGKYYHCTKKADKTYWITLVKPKGNSKARRLVLGSINDPKSRLSRIEAAVKMVAQRSRYGYVIKKHVEDIEPKACGNQRQYSKAAFDILEFLKRIEAIGSKERRIIIYREVKEAYQTPLPTVRQIRFDEIFEEQSKAKNDVRPKETSDKQK